MLKYSSLKVLLAASLFSAVGHAEDKFKYYFEFPLLSYESKSEKTEISLLGLTRESTTKTTSMSTADRESAYFKAMVNDKFVVTYHPFSDSKTIGGGMKIGEQLELGLNLGLNSAKLDKPKDEKKYNVFGFYAEYEIPMGKNSLELTGTLASLASKTVTTDTAGVESTVTTSNAIVALGADFICPITEQI